MTYQYRPRGMPRRFMEGAPEILRRSVIDLIKIRPAAPLDYDVILRPNASDDMVAQVVGLDFGKDGAQGCHFFLERHEARDYRERNRRKRVAWRDLPAATQSAIVAYLEETP